MAVILDHPHVPARQSARTEPPAGLQIQAVAGTRHRPLPHPERERRNRETAVEDTRLPRLYPRYRKTSDGPLVIAEIGIDAIRKGCPHADAWLTAVNTGLTRQR
ncbi:DUF4276 family protein [Nonomuraea glycinis]|uniref:DUF4276 family protein n=1 Tax=Nonomuraea glycinis TaxID=2047744 RepID=UPI0033A1EFAF